jgi:putative membrane protein
MIDVATDNSLNQSMNNAKRHYASLFFLPSFKTALIALATICIIAGVSTVVFSPSYLGLATGLFLGIALLAINFTTDYILSNMVLRDRIFVLRRTLVLSLFSWIFWIFFLIIGVIMGSAFGFLWWVRLCLFGFSTLLTLRTVVFLSVSSANFVRRIAAILFQPLGCIIAFAAFWTNMGISLQSFLPFITIAPFVACISAFIFVHLLDRIGKKTYGVPSISIFKAFMLNWVSALNGPLEEHLEKMGRDTDIEVSLLKFDSSKPKAAIVVPLVHPGPFNNIGSSLLPSLLKQEFEKEYGCETCVPLGILGHELDAASQAQNYKIINQVVASARFASSIKKATPFIRVSKEFVAASCQVFGKTALLSFTLAPKTTEDLPQELGTMVRKEAEKLGFDFVTVVNAHNSLTSSVEIEASLETLLEVASKCLQEAASQELYSFEVGSATVYPSDFTLKDGMGTGGITAIVIKVANQKTAYIVIDGNNMVSGLREKIISSLKLANFQESEIFTTDTHAVSAVVVGHRGYHPIGEAIDQEKIINYIKEAAQKAEGGLEPCKAGYLQITVPKVRVIGGDCLNFMTVLVDKTIKMAKRIIVPVFGIEGLMLLLLLAILVT